MSIKSIKEKELLVNFARAMGQAVDPKLAEEVDRINAIRNSVRASVSENIFKDLGAAVNTTKVEPKYEKDDGPLSESQLEQIQETSHIDFPKPPSLDELLLVLNEQIEEVKNELVQTQPEKKSLETETPVSNTPVAKTLADRTSEFLSKSKDSFQQPDPLKVAPDMDAITKKLRFLEQWIGKVSMAGPGSGEVNLRNLDDVNRSAIADDKYLRYESSIGKFTFDSGHKNNFHGAWQSNVKQFMPNDSSNVASLVTYNAADYQYKFRLESNSRIVAEEPGRYNLQYSIQLENSGAATESAHIWLRQNGQDVPRTNSKYDVLGKHAGANGAIIAAINYFYETTVANEYVELAWWATHNDVFLSTIPAITAVPGVNPSIPETPTVIVTVSHVKIDSNN